jgi:hypothetical protein
MAARPIRPDPTNRSRPVSGRIGVSLDPISGPIAPRGCAMATGTGVCADGSADTAAATGRNAMISRPVVVVALRIARMLTSLPSLVRPCPPRVRFSRPSFVQAICHAENGVFFKVYAGGLRLVIRGMPSRDKEFLSGGRVNCRGSFSQTRGNVTGAARERSRRSGPSPASRQGARSRLKTEHHTDDRQPFPPSDVARRT